MVLNHLLGEGGEGVLALSTRFCSPSPNQGHLLPGAVTTVDDPPIPMTGGVLAYVLEFFCFFFFKCTFYYSPPIL